MEANASPLVSVLVPICNVERYLDQCLESARVQTLKDIEIICVNDGSTDGSLEIIKKFMAKDTRFKLIDKANSGYGDSMNRGLDIASGKYISILESDDFLDADALEYMVNKAESEGLEVFKCNFWLYWTEPGLERLNHHNLYFSALSPEAVAIGPHSAVDVPEVFWSKASIWSAIYRRSFLDANNIRFLPTPGASFQDTSFTFKVLCCAKKIAFSSRAFLHYRQDNEGSSVNNPGKVFCVCDEHEEMSRFLNEDRPDLKQQVDPIRAKVKFYNYLWNLNRLAPKLRLEFLPRFAKEMREEFEAGNIIVCRNEFGHLGFAPGEVEDIKRIAYDTDFYAVHCGLENNSKLETLRAYGQAGGFGFVKRAFSEKLHRR